MSLELPITPGRYRTRGGEVATVTQIDPAFKSSVWGDFKGNLETWMPSGHYWPTLVECLWDLVSRIEDEPKEPNPLIAPLEWALGQLEESLDPDWQAAYKAATEALKLAKQK